MRVLAAVLAAMALLQGSGAMESFQGYQVVQIDTLTEETFQLVTMWIEQHPGVDVWKSPFLGGHAHLNLPKEEIDQLQLPYTVFVDDVEAMIYESFAKSATQDWHAEYHPIDEINDYITGFADRFANVPGVNAEIFDIGQSWENRTIYGIKFGGSSVANPVRIVWNGIHHAREWIGPATLMYIIDELLTGFNVDSRITQIVQQTEFHIVPVLNPDGYSYTWTNSRLWRKTRSTYNGNLAIGTDPNRNWDYQWGGAGASTSPFSDTYRGPSAFSEPEVEQWAQYIGALTNVGGYIDWHSYGQYILSAWGYTSTLPPDYEDQVALGMAMNDAMRAVNNRPYLVGPSGATLYPTSGSAPDYTYGENGIVFSYTIELPGSPGGFILPPQYIVGVGEESLEGALVSVEGALRRMSTD